jgi:hypothetical protein
MGYCITYTQQICIYIGKNWKISTKNNTRLNYYKPTKTQKTTTDPKGTGNFCSDTLRSVFSPPSS